MYNDPQSILERNILLRDVPVTFIRKINQVSYVGMENHLYNDMYVI